MSMNQPVQIKGTNNGFRIIIKEETTIGITIDFINEWRNQNVTFFTSSQLDFIIIGKKCTREEKKQLANYLYNQFDVRSLTFGEQEKSSRSKEHITINKNYSFDIIEKTIRSGERIKRDGHIMVLGDVNPGGEVVAGGSVIVWGALRGLVHAGTIQEDAIIIAQKMIPLQLRIGKKIAVPPKGDKGSDKPEMAYINNGQLAIRTII